MRKSIGVFGMFIAAAISCTFLFFKSDDSFVKAHDVASITKSCAVGNDLVEGGGGSSSGNGLFEVGDGGHSGNGLVGGGNGADRGGLVDGGGDNAGNMP